MTTSCASEVAQVSQTPGPLILVSDTGCANVRCGWAVIGFHTVREAIPNAVRNSSTGQV